MTLMTLTMNMAVQLDSEICAHFSLDEIIHGLTANYRQGSKIPGRPSTSDKEERLNGKLHILRQNEGKKKDCLVCSKRKVKGGRHETRYICNTCTLKPGLHIGDCFERYHTMQNYKM